MLSVMVDYILELADSIIAGNMLGDKALAGVTLCQPFFSFFLVCAGAHSYGNSCALF
jgi:Na+-driven multidrug efflux pump